MDFIQAIVLGFLQGLFEWLPVSSQGQIMALSMAFFGISALQAARYAIMLHMGTLFSAIFYLRKDIAKVLASKDVQTIKFLVIAVLATGVTGLPCYFILKKLIASESQCLVALIGALLITMGFLLLLVGFMKKTPQKGKKPNNKDAIITGLAQGLSVLPGISRSGITVAALLFRKFDSKQALKLSFLLSIPSIAIAELILYAGEPFAIDSNAIAGMIAAFLTGLLLIHVLIKAAEKINFASFCIIFGLVYISIALFDIVAMV